MKIHVEIDESLSETEIYIRTPSLSQEVIDLEAELRKKQKTLALFQENTQFYVSIHDILFFETEGKDVVAHTADQIFHSDYRLYELEAILPSSFMRISKSAIVNLNKVFGITRNVSTCLIQFQNSHKHVYASRQYYKKLRERLDENRKEN